jgi:hypothetical protein
MLRRFRPPNARERGLSRGEIYKKEERKEKKAKRKKKEANAQTNPNLLLHSRLLFIHQTKASSGQY